MTAVFENELLSLVARATDGTEVRMKGGECRHRTKGEEGTRLHKRGFGSAEDGEDPGPEPERGLVSEGHP